MRYRNNQKNEDVERALMTNESDGIARYSLMQRTNYDRNGMDRPDDVVGSYYYHDNFPYETQLLFINGDVRKPIFPDFGVRRAFDFGCGEGRMVRRMQRFFGQVDGCDISKEMLKHARARTNDSNFYVSSGLDAGETPSCSYDFVYCTVSLQHICVHAIRQSIILDLRRILKPDGKMTLQLLFSKYYPFVATSAPVSVGDRGVQLYRKDEQHATWFQNKFDATHTNSGCDVVIGTDELGSGLID